MSATNSPGRAAHCLQLVAALDRYLSRLDELDSSQPGQIEHHLTDLTDSVRRVRVVCAAFPSLQSLLFELLIGHSELVSKVAQRPERSDGRNARSTLVAAQRRRAATLLPEIHAPNESRRGPILRSHSSDPQPKPASLQSKLLNAVTPVLGPKPISA
jgi:hypothetical protein